MTLELTEQEHQYLLQVMLQQPVREALPLVLKLTGQQLTPVGRGQNEATASALGDLRAAKG